MTVSTNCLMTLSTICITSTLLRSICCIFIKVVRTIYETQVENDFQLVQLKRNYFGKQVFCRVHQLETKTDCQTDVF